MKRLAAMVVLTGVLGGGLVRVSGSEPRHTLMIPIGRTVLSGENSYEILVDDEPFDAPFVWDGYGGYWVEVPVDLAQNESVVLRVTRVRGAVELFQEPDEDVLRWLEPSRLIDADNPELEALAAELVAGAATNAEKARIISSFVIRHLTFKVYPLHFLIPASKTYELGFGTCVNFSRLFVALSRAAGLPARTVWGAIQSEYDDHHEWAEYLDDEGAWQPADFTFTHTLALSDVR